MVWHLISMSVDDDIDLGDELLVNGDGRGGFGLRMRPMPAPGRGGMREWPNLKRD